MNQHLERIEGLHPLIKDAAAQLLAKCELTLKRQLLVVRGWSSNQEQMLLFQKGRTLNRETGVWEISDKAAIVTHSQPGLSAHNVITKLGGRASMALDVIPLNDDGTPQWDVDQDFWDDLWEIAWRVGLDPLGDPIGSYLAGDLGHFEEPAWKLKLTGLGLLQPVTT